MRNAIPFKLKDEIKDVKNSSRAGFKTKEPKELL